MSTAISEYLNRYNVQCAKSKLTPYLFYQKELDNHIEQGTDMESLILRGHQPELRLQRITDTMIHCILIPFQGLQIHLNTLDLSYNQISDAGALVIAQFIKDCKALYEVYLDGNDIGSEGAQALSEALQTNETVYFFSMKKNPIEGKGGMALATMLQINDSLTTLIVSNCGLPLSVLMALCSVIAPHPKLHTLDLSNNQVGFEQLSPSLRFDFMVQLAHLLQFNPHLRTLDLSLLRLDDFHITQELVQALSENHTLTSLDLSRNGLRKDGLISLLQAFPRMTSLMYLDLSHNPLGDEALGLFLERYLKLNLNLQCLKLRSIGAKEVSLLSFAYVLQHCNTKVLNLALWGNTFTSQVNQVWAMHLASSLFTKEVKRFQHHDLDVCFYFTKEEENKEHEDENENDDKSEEHDLNDLTNEERRDELEKHSHHKQEQVLNEEQLLPQQPGGMVGMEVPLNRIKSEPKNTKRGTWHVAKNERYQSMPFGLLTRE